MTAGSDSTAGSAGAVIDDWLLARLVCPVTRMPLRFDAVTGELVADQAGLAYPIRDGVPILLVEAARRIGDAPRDLAAPSTR